MKENSKIKVKATTAKLPNCAAKDYEMPDCRMTLVVTPDEEKYIPSFTSQYSVNLIAKIPDNGSGNKTVSLPYRSTETIDCGTALKLPDGYAIDISAKKEFASKGLMVLSVPNLSEDSRLKVVVGNVGKEIVMIKDGDEFLKMHFYAIPEFKWEINCGKE